MGRRCSGDLIRKTTFEPTIHVPGRRIFLGVIGHVATILYSTRQRAAIFTHRPERIVVVTRPRFLILFANLLPRRWRRPQDGYWLLYLGRGHPLANSAGWQYEHRLVGFGLAGRTDGIVCRVPDQNRSREPEAIELRRGAKEHLR